MTFGFVAKLGFLVRRSVRQARTWLTERAAEPVENTNPDEAFPLPALRRRTIPLLAMGAGVFFIAIGVRLLYWQDYGVYVYDRAEVQRILDGVDTFSPASPPKSGDATLVVHPPGYTLLMQGIFRVFDGSVSSIAFVQVIADSLAAVILLLVAAELLPFGVAVISAVLVALSPHLTHYSLHLSPESLSVLPILLAVYFLIRAIKRPCYVGFIAVGVCVGLSCWLRANGMLLAPFIGVVMIFSFTRGKRRIVYAGTIVAAAALVIAPITIRNWIVYHHFIPLSIGAGVTLITGIADYDTEGRFGFPRVDSDVQKQEAEMYGRPEYARNLEDPNGIERDRARLARGLAVIRSNPFWFARVMLRRAGFMLRYNDPGHHDWPYTTAIVPIISAEPTPRRSLQTTDAMQPVWTNSPYEFFSRGKIISPDARVFFDEAHQALLIAGDSSEYGDQIRSEDIAVQKNTDHVLGISLKAMQGEVAVKIMSIDNRVTLASANIKAFVEKRAFLERRKKKKGEITVEADAIHQRIPDIQLGFASGNRTKVCIAFSNNGTSLEPSGLSITEARIFAMGATPYLWTGYPRPTIRSIQKKLFRTTAMLSLIVAGIVSLAVAGRRRALSVLLIVPVYYLSVQSVLHTEYRYVLAIHYFLFIMSAFSIYCIFDLLNEGLRRTIASYFPRTTESARRKLKAQWKRFSGDRKKRSSPA